MDNWVSCFNFFLLLKAILRPDNKEYLFKMLHKVLIESTVAVADEVRILIVELVE